MDKQRGGMIVQGWSCHHAEILLQQRAFTQHETRIAPRFEVAASLDDNLNMTHFQVCSISLFRLIQNGENHGKKTNDTNPRCDFDSASAENVRIECLFI